MRKHISNKKLSKGIMTKYILRSNCKSVENMENYTKQLNCFVRLLRNSEKEFHVNLNESNITDTKASLKTVKPFLLHKATNHSKITLINNDEVMQY